MYPNPITSIGVAEITVPENLHLNNDVTFSVNFLDLNGRVVSSYNNIAPLNAGAIIRFNVNLSDLPAGIYMAQLSYGDTPVETTKVVVVR
ncbi:MAG: T9SS type A sorting domain-containing protein [Bacteroidetes bacterium]|nr:T9SS type A sorting domain-containing protein [Bacteroidota bacterium]